MIYIYIYIIKFYWRIHNSRLYFKINKKKEIKENNDISCNVIVL